MKVLFFLQPGANSRSIFCDMIRGFKRAGVETIIWELQPVWDLYRRQAQRPGGDHTAMAHEMALIVAGLIKSNRVDLSIGMWANGVLSLAGDQRHGKPISFFDAIDNPHLSFWLDGPGWAHGGELRDQFPAPMLNGPCMYHLINNEGMASEMRRVLGMSRVSAHPYGVDAGVFCPKPQIERDFDLVFAIGPGDEPPTALMRQELTRDEPDVAAIRAEQAQRVRKKLEPIAQRSADPGSMMRLFDRLVATQLDNQHRPMLDRLDELVRDDDALRGALRALLGNAGMFLEATALVRQIEQWERAFTITYLARRLRCAVFGGGALDGWDCSATNLGQLEYAEQADGYARGHLALNVMRWQDDIGVNIKPIEIAACGSVGLMRRRVGLDRMLIEGEQVVCFDTPAEALAKAQRLLGDHDRLESIRQAGHQRVLDEHTWTTRAGELLTDLGERTGRWTWPR